MNETNYTKVPEKTNVENSEIWILSASILVGFIVNVQPYINKPERRSVKCAYSMIKSQLFISNFLIFFAYALPKIFWLITYRWVLGDTMCKVYKFMSTLAFYSNSNFNVSIALERMICVMSHHVQGSNSQRRGYIFIIVSWLIAIVASIPQVFFWHTVQPIDCDWYQCVSSFNKNIITSDNHVLLGSMAAAIYEMIHLSLVFWVPLIVITGAFAIIRLELIDRHEFGNEDTAVLPCVNHEERTREENYDNNSSTSETPFSTINTPNKGPNSGIADSCILRRRERSRSIQEKIFKHARNILLLHTILWLPYNIMSVLRFVNESYYEYSIEHGGTLVEVLIVFNSVINPIVYADPQDPPAADTNIFRNFRRIISSYFRF